MGHLPKVIQWIICAIGFPITFLYHALMWNPFLNVAATDAKGLEKIANHCLTPIHYLCVGKCATPTDDPEVPYQLVQRFDYNSSFITKTTLSAAATPVLVPLGCLLKGVAFLSPEVRERHNKIAQSIKTTKIKSNQSYYHMIGLLAGDLTLAERIAPAGYQRAPGEENVLAQGKVALKEIGRLLQKHNIPYWVDNGTCLGAYRYGGVIPWDFDIDIGVLSADFENIWHALQELDPQKYQVQDWSSRYSNVPFLKVYVRDGGMLIDIFHYDIDPDNQLLKRTIANEDSRFLSLDWLEHERQYTQPIPFHVVFPLKLAEFDGQLVPVPKETKLFLQSKYGENIDPVRIYSQETGRYEKVEGHPYWLRVNVY